MNGDKSNARTTAATRPGDAYLHHNQKNIGELTSMLTNSRSNHVKRADVYGIQKAAMRVPQEKMTL